MKTVILIAQRKETGKEYARAILTGAKAEKAESPDSFEGFSNTLKKIAATKYVRARWEAKNDVCLLKENRETYEKFLEEVEQERENFKISIMQQDIRDGQ